MFNMISDIALVFIFFVTFKLYDIYVATAVAIATATFTVILSRVLYKKFDKKQIILLLLLLLFGGMTLYFHNPLFIKWKPTVVFWLIASVFLAYQLLSPTLLIERFLSRHLPADHKVTAVVWRRLNRLWILFFIFMGALNALIAYFCSDNTWVNFKVYGILGGLLLFSILQSLYLSRYLSQK